MCFLGERGLLRGLAYFVGERLALAHAERGSEYGRGLHGCSHIAEEKRQTLGCYWGL